MDPKIDTGITIAHEQTQIASGNTDDLSNIKLKAKMATLEAKVATFKAMVTQFKAESAKKDALIAALQAKSDSTERDYMRQLLFGASSSAEGIHPFHAKLRPHENTAAHAYKTPLNQATVGFQKETPTAENTSFQDEFAVIDEIQGFPNDVIVMVPTENESLRCENPLRNHEVCPQDQVPSDDMAMVHENDVTADRMITSVMSEFVSFIQNKAVASIENEVITCNKNDILANKVMTSVEYEVTIGNIKVSKEASIEKRALLNNIIAQQETIPGIADVSLQDLMPLDKVEGFREGLNINPNDTKDLVTASHNHKVSQEPTSDSEDDTLSRCSTPLSILSRTPSLSVTPHKAKHSLEFSKDSIVRPAKQARIESEDGLETADGDYASTKVVAAAGDREIVADPPVTFSAAVPAGLQVAAPAALRVAVPAAVLAATPAALPALLPAAVPAALPDNQPQPQYEIWATKRQAMCEALPYYKSYKGSFYTNGKTLHGVMLDVQAEPNDVFTSQVIISSIGGGRTRDGATGEMVRVADSRDNNYLLEAITKAGHEQTPVVIIAGEGHPLYPCTPPAPYAVLDYFHVTNVWKEAKTQSSLDAQGAQVIRIWKVRFEKIDLDKISWWHPDGLHSKVGPPLPSAECTTCRKESPAVFSRGWTCLNHGCRDYYHSLTADDASFGYSELQYSPEFINQRNPFNPFRAVVPDLRPEVPDLVASGSNGTDAFARGGIVCPKCGLCNSRIFWNRWECTNSLCDFVKEGLMLPYPKATIEHEEAELARKFRPKNAVVNLGISPYSTQYDPFAGVLRRSCVGTTETQLCGRYTVRQYILPDPGGHAIGSFTLFVSNQDINEREGGPDNMLRMLETTDIGLKRNPVAVKGHKLEGLSRHFQQNFGAKYKFGVDVQSKGFKDAPPVILQALQRLIWASGCAVNMTAANLKKANYQYSIENVPESSSTFNELLALGYMEKDSINYHDDGEKELGPTVAAVSLGSPSIMRFRPKRNSGFGPKMAEKKVTGKCHYKDVLEVPMKHGDMMVMHGRRIHGLYEHAVEPVGGRRFSLTSRFVDPATMDSEEDREAALINGEIPASASKFVYDGN